MKKFLTASLSVIMIALASVAVSAAKPAAADFEAENGFFFGPTKTEATEYTTSKNEDFRSVPTVADDGEGVKVAHKGYFVTGADCGGVHSVNAYDLNGLSVTIKLDVVPTVNSDTDCWFAIDFVEKPDNFYTDAENNRGIENLIRFGGNYIALYEAVTSWAGVWSSNGNVDADKAVAFGLKSGDVVTMTVNRTENNTYALTFKNGATEIALPYEFSVAEVFPLGKAYLNIVGSCELGDQEGFVYHITDITNGAPLTEEEIAAIEAAKAAKELEQKISDATKAIEAVAGDADELLEKAADNEDAKAIVEEAIALIDEAKAAVESKEFELEDIQATCDEAADLLHDAKAALKGDKAEGEDAEEATEGEQATAKAGLPLWLIIVIVVAVIVIVVVVVLVSKKKKN